MVPRDKTCRFRAKIYTIGVNRCVDVPERVSRALVSGTRIPVVGTVGGERLRSTLVPRGGGLHRLFIHSNIWRKLGVDSGDIVNIACTRDRQAGRLRLPPEIMGAFPLGSQARVAFDAQTVAARRRFVTWVMDARTPQTRRRRIREFAHMILKKQKTRKP